ncbi:hypothetical protein [Phytohabitans houttuyneae]|uniref:Uncharacterized protein n=1 Tax=Phytohabitans houttuyneae TaxID=1076126 RepID=A0A6V8KBW6_9ACTN|nr:hypothetical protein [Phytohabitans houttuyneae]GFJ79476.1 hypothetical protein Phou_036560 [Phytohabitans houttuyneae]
MTTEAADLVEGVEAAGATDEIVPRSTKDRIAAAKLPERTVDICLRGDLQAEWEELERQLREAFAREQGDKRLNSGGESRRLAQQIEALQGQMRADTLVFRMRALPRKKWTALQKDHPPRKDNEADQELGYNVDDFVPAAIKACTVEPADLDDAAWEHLLDEVLTEYQFVQLQNTAYALNVNKVNVPNSFAASRILRPSEPE